MVYFRKHNSQHAPHAPQFMKCAPVLRFAKRLILGLLLIVAAAAVLVLSDRSNSRQRNDDAGIATEAARPRRTAVIQISAIDAMNVGRNGMLERLNSARF
jgi:hypothetical protein